jgi:hypothetical protein
VMAPAFRRGSGIFNVTTAFHATTVFNTTMDSLGDNSLSAIATSLSQRWQGCLEMMMIFSTEDKPSDGEIAGFQGQGSLTTAFQCDNGFQSDSGVLHDNGLSDDNRSATRQRLSNTTLGLHKSVNSNLWSELHATSLTCAFTYVFAWSDLMEECFKYDIRSGCGTLDALFVADLAANLAGLCRRLSAGCSCGGAVDFAFRDRC